jgi:8-oxo-dGTP pyrophosphatase MutT (NUDIX family)
VTTALHAEAVRMLTGWRPDTPDQDSLRHAFLSYLAARPDGCRRECVPGHLTASTALVDSAGDHVLLTLHPRIGRWVQLGGHCEDGDATMAAAALREATEESGIGGITIDPRPLHVAVHPITCSLGRATRHLDVRFLGVAPPDAVPSRCAESLDLRWWPIDALPAAPAVAGDVPMLATLAARRRSLLQRLPDHAP